MIHFSWAIIALAVGAVTGMFAEGYVYRRILKSCADARTAEKIGDKFYYIVPEREYVSMIVPKDQA